MPKKKATSLSKTKKHSAKKTTKKSVVKKTVKKPAAKKKTRSKKVAKKVAPKKKAVTKKQAKKKQEKKKQEKKVLSMHANDVHEPTPPVAHVCRSCHALPAGSIELVSLLIVLVFALSAVLITSVYALNQQTHEIDALQEQIVHAQE